MQVLPSLPILTVPWDHVKQGQGNYGTMSSKGKGFIAGTMSSNDKGYMTGMHEGEKRARTLEHHLPIGQGEGEAVKGQRQTLVRGRQAPNIGEVLAIQLSIKDGEQLHIPAVSASYSFIYLLACLLMCLLIYLLLCLLICLFVSLFFCFLFLLRLNVHPFGGSCLLKKYFCSSLVPTTENPSF